MSISLFQALGMYLRQVPVRRMRAIVNTVERQGLDVAVDALEAHYLAGGNPERVVEAMSLARGRSREVSFQRLAAVDLMGEDPVEFVRSGGDSGAA